YGAGMGSLCTDILEQLRHNKKFFERLMYCIIEKSEAMRQKEQNGIEHLSINKKVFWYNSIEEIPVFTGCVLANEVLDNFSVHKVIMKENELQEIFVDYDNGFIEVP